MNALSLKSREKSFMLYKFTDAEASITHLNSLERLSDQERIKFPIKLVVDVPFRKAESWDLMNCFDIRSIEVRVRDEEKEKLK